MGHGLPAPRVSGFRQLRVWQKAKALAVDVYRLTSAGPLAKDFALKDQLQRSAVSVPSNIAEGDERESNRESVRFFYIAKGSVAELRTQLEIARDIGCLPESLYLKTEQDCADVARMLGALIKVRSSDQSITHDH